MPKPPTVSAAALGIVRRQLSRVGLPEEEIVQASGLGPEAFSASLVDRVPLEQEYRLWEALHAANTDPSLHLQLAAQTQLGDFFWGDMLFASSADLFTAIKFFEYFAATITESWTIRSSVANDELRVDFELAQERRFGLELIEFGLLNFVRRVRDIAPGGAGPQRIELTRPTCERVQAVLDAQCGCPIHFASRVDRVVYPAGLLSMPTRKSHQGDEDALREVARAHERLPGLEGDAGMPKLGTLRSLILKNLLSQGLSGGLSIESLAENLGVSERSLQRLFEAHKLSYRQTLLELKMLLASYFLRTRNFSIYDISRALGYANESNFLRVFKKQFGTTPSRHRQGK